MAFGADDLTAEETAKYQALAASGNQEELMNYVSGLSCKYDGKPLNFGDGVHRTCGPSTGGKKRKSRKHKKSHKKSKKSKKSKKHHKKSKKSKKSKK
jgi:hypothetical protein